MAMFFSKTSAAVFRRSVSHHGRPLRHKICLENDNHAASNIHYKRRIPLITSAFVNVNASHTDGQQKTISIRNILHMEDIIARSPPPTPTDRHPQLSPPLWCASVCVCVCTPVCVHLCACVRQCVFTHLFLC